MVKVSMFKKLISLFSNKKKLLLILSVALDVNICFTGVTAVSDVISNGNMIAYQRVLS